MPLEGIYTAEQLGQNGWQEVERFVIGNLPCTNCTVALQWVYHDGEEYGPLNRYGWLRVAHAPGMPGTFSAPTDLKGNRQSAIPTGITAPTRPLSDKKPMGFLSDSGHARAVMHAGIANPRWRGKRSRHFRRMCNPRFYVSGKKPTVIAITIWRMWIMVGDGLFILDTFYWHCLPNVWTRASYYTHNCVITHPCPNFNGELNFFKVGINEYPYPSILHGCNHSSTVLVHLISVAPFTNMV